MPPKIQSTDRPAAARLPLASPATDPTPLFELFRGSFSTELLVAAVAHFDVFARLAPGPLSFGQLGLELGLAERPLIVLLTALRAMGLITRDEEGRFTLTPLADEHLVAGGPFYVGDYFALAAESPGVGELADRLRTNRPKGAKPGESGVGFIFRPGLKSAMEEERGARAFTLALAGRAKNVAPVLAARLPLPEARLLLDTGGGTGLYSIALLQSNRQLRAIVWDRPEVLRVAAEFSAASGVSDRLELRAGDMFTDPFPAGPDVILLSNILHDWDVPQCRHLVGRCGAALPAGGRLLVHDVFLNDELDGPLATALYSAALFSVTEGRVYSAAECQAWLSEAGLRTTQKVPTLVHCSVLVGTKP